MNLDICVRIEFVYQVCPRDWSVSQWCRGAEGVTLPPVNGLMKMKFWEEGQVYQHSLAS